MAALDFPTATAAGQTFEADTGVIYVYVGTPPNGFWSANATVSGQAALDARYVQVAGDSMTGALNVAGNVGIGTTSPTTKVEVVDTLQATANNDYTLAIRGDDSGTDGESAQIFLGAINATTRGTVIAAERQSTSNDHDLIFKTSAVSSAPTERLRIDSSGRVGIGDTAPGANLVVKENGATGTDHSLQQWRTAGGGFMQLRNENLGLSQPYFEFTTGTNEDLIFSPGGNIGIGTTSPISELHVENSSGNCGARVISGTSGVSYLNLGDTADNNIGSIEYDNSVNVLKIITNNNERMRIDSSGRLLVGTSTIAVSYTDWKLQVSGQALIGSYLGATASAYSLNFIKSRSSSVGSYAIVSSGDKVGGLDFKADDGADYETSAARIEAYVDGAAGTNDMPGRLVFSTTADGSSSPTERMRINSSGNVGIGTTAPGYPLHVIGGTNGIQLAGTDNLNSGWRIATPSSNVSAFGTLDGQNTAFGTFNGSTDAFTEAMRIDSSGRLLVGTSSDTSAARFIVQGLSSDVNAQGVLDIRRGTRPTAADTEIGSIRFKSIAGDGRYAQISAYSDGASGSDSDTPGSLRFSTTPDGSSGATERVRIDSSGNVGVGGTPTVFTGQNFISVHSPGSSTNIAGLDFYASGTRESGLLAYPSNSENLRIFGNTARAITVHNNGSERMRIDSSGDVMIGTTSNTAHANADNLIVGSTGGTHQGMTINGSSSSQIRFADSNSNSVGYAIYEHTNNSFQIGVNGSERVRIDSSGNVGIGTTSHKVSSSSDQGHWIGAPGSFAGFATASNPVIYVNRISSDGELIRFRHNGIDEGNISVSGTTVSYNGAHLARWSQLPGNAVRFNILRGTVLSNIDEMCAWGEETNEQLNRMKISDVEGDRNVSGVFQAWDEDDDEYTDDFYCAMTGDFVIRIGKEVTVELGDLLMSAGDGTAKPQEDDIIRSKTIAKVTSTHVSETYADGSYCVPCVLMAC